MIVTTADSVSKHGLDVAARLVTTGVGAVEPGMFGLGPVRAVHQAVERVGLSMGDIEWAENRMHTITAVVFATIGA